MHVGDQVLYYHSITKPGVVGIAKVVREAYPDPTASVDVNPITGVEKLNQWVVVELEPMLAFDRAVSLAQIKAEPLLASISLIRQTRLSVMPIRPDEFELIVKMGGVGS